MKIFYITLAYCFLAVFAEAQALFPITVDVANEIKEISPYIYGRNNNLSDDPRDPVPSAVWQFYKDAGLKFFRESGGNNSTKYNWRRKLSSHPDWYNNVYAHDWDYAATSLQENMPEAKGMWAFQLLGYAAKTNAANFPDWDWQQAGNEPQPHEHWCGNGDYTRYLEEWPADSTVGILNQWFDVLGLNKDQFQYWNMDNEPEVWLHTHDDVMPAAIPVEDYISRYVAVAKRAREEFPEIRIVGPVFNNEWQWYSWQNNEKIPDPENPGIKYCWIEYFIKRIAEEQNRYGMRLVDVLDFHFYPKFFRQDNARAITRQLHRVFYDTTYDYPLANGCKVLDDSGWDNNITKEYIWKRANDWLTNYMGPDHGVTMGLSEFGLEYEDPYTEDPNVVAVTYASMLGTFAENNVEIFSPWHWYKGQWEVMHLFTRYAGTTAVKSSLPDNDLVSVYSSINAGKDTLTVILVNGMDGDWSVSVSLQHATTEEPEVSYYRLSNLPVDRETFISKENNAVQIGSVEIDNRYYLSMILPKLSVTAVQIPVKIETSFPHNNQDLPNDITFSLYPNPATYQTKLAAGGLTGDVTVTITDMLGRILKTIRTKATNGKIETTIDISVLGKGVYFVNVQNNGLYKSKKLIVR